jgi:aldehyde dehydrogenase
MKYVAPGRPGSIVTVQPRYENFIGGKWQEPTSGRYVPDLSPATAKPICEVPQSTPEDIELALDAAEAAGHAWAESSPARRAEVLTAVADAIDAHRPGTGWVPACGRATPTGRTGWAGRSRPGGSG